MSEKVEDGGFAFPCDSTNKQFPTQEGMTLRDYFASQCPLTINEFVAVYGFRDLPSLFDDSNEGHWEAMLILFSEYRYDYADAMLKARTQCDT
jgi:hypothetical protein